MYLLETVNVGDVIDNNCDCGISDVGGNEGTKALLPSCVPKLQAHRSILKIHSL